MRVKEFRNAAGLSQGQLATYAGVDRSWLTRLEQGHYADTSYRRLRSLARVLGVSTDVLAGDEPEAPVLDSTFDTLEAALRRLRRLMAPSHGNAEEDGIEHADRQIGGEELGEV